MKIGLGVLSLIFISFVSIAGDYRFQPITKERIEGDKEKIEQFLEETKKNINLAKTFGKWTCWAVHGLSYRAYDCMPAAFFDDKNFITYFKTSESLYTRESISNINNNKTHIHNNFVKNDKIDSSRLAEFLFDSMVDRLSLTDAQRSTIKKDPLKIKKFIKQELTSSEYKNLTLQNLISHYYLEKELGKRK